MCFVSVSCISAVSASLSVIWLIFSTIELMHKVMLLFLFSSCMYHVVEVLQQVCPQGYLSLRAAAQGLYIHRHGHEVSWLTPNLFQVQFVWKSGETPDWKSFEFILALVPSTWFQNQSVSTRLVLALIGCRVCSFQVRGTHQIGSLLTSYYGGVLFQLY